MPYLNNQSEKSEMANLTASYFRKSSIFLIWDNTSGCANQPRVLNKLNLRKLIAWLIDWYDHYEQ